MADEDLRTLEREAERGDTLAMVRASRALARQGRHDAALEWLELARAAGEASSEHLALLLGDSSDVLLLSRLAILGDPAAADRLQHQFPALATIWGTADERRPSGFGVGDPPPVRPTPEIEAALDVALTGPPDVQLAALLLAFDRVAAHNAQRTFHYQTVEQVKAIKKLASRILRRKRAWKERDLVSLLGQIAATELADSFPWAAVLGLVERATDGVLPSRLRLALTAAWKSSLNGRHGHMASEAKFQLRAKALLDRE